MLNQFTSYILALIFFFAPCAIATNKNIQIPVRFIEKVPKKIKSGDKLKIEVVMNSYNGNKKIASRGDFGYVNVTKVKRPTGLWASKKTLILNGAVLKNSYGQTVQAETKMKFHTRPTRVSVAWVLCYISTIAVYSFGAAISGGATGDMPFIQKEIDNEIEKLAYRGETFYLEYSP